MLARAGRAAEQSRPAAEAVRVVAIGKTKPVSLLRQLRRELRPGVYHQGAAASRRYPVAFRRTLAEQQDTAFLLLQPQLAPMTPCMEQVKALRKVPRRCWTKAWRHCELKST
ncbi:uncharacterized protein LOC119363611 isoform X3 [Triticum dicoccoides]|uniref:uncharacterized protein LOC119363611 isoform X3 n=1 Tax=Triticum dicoccoides TaxID=85692 RepID=UPI00188E949B|nr:uncharacterized protein LOC119363611 isoform X3 [Triticum dicoccoides]